MQDFALICFAGGFLVGVGTCLLVVTYALSQIFAD